MTRRKVFIAFAAAVMILVLTAALFVACDQTKTYTVTFKNGEAVVKTVSVQDGATIADADVPADLEDTDDAVFEGWFNGEVAFDKTAAITGDVTYTAKWTSLFTVTFKDGDTVIATAKVKDGEKIADADIPADLTDTDSAAFEGWFNGDAAFDKDAAIVANVTYNAKWTGLYNVTFMNGDEQIKAVKVKDGAVISASDIPADLADTDFAFIGWFVGDAAYDKDAAVTSNIVVNAKFSTFFKSYFGTWHGATDDWDSVAYTVVVDATSISVKIDSAAAQIATDIDVDTDGSVMFKIGDTEYMLYEYYDGNLRILESDEIALSAELEGRVHVSSSEIVGTYATEGGHTIVINSTFAKVDGVLGTGFYYNSYSGYSWSIDDKYASLAYDSDAAAWIYKEDYSSDADKLIVPELVAIDIPEEFIGSWYCMTESFGATSYFLVKVSADGVFAYNPGSGYAKVGVATEYKDGELTIVGLDETITASIVDGKLAYKSDSAYGADYELSKGKVLVFEHEYSLFYIAELNEDGTIKDTFALEEPTMKAGYTFKGWVNELDLVTEFDEDATYADSAVFQSKSEKTGYVLTFKKTSSDSDPTIVVVEIANGKLAADQIPAALTYEDGSVFTGWYTTAGVKAEADLAITADTTFIAKSVKESDYEGTWINTTSGKEAMATIADGKVTFGYGVSNVAYTFNTEDGSLTFSATISYSKHTFVVVKTSSGITISDSYYDRSAEEDVTDSYELATPKSSYFAKTVAGTYQCSNSETIVILENGIVSKFDGSTTTYGYISGTKNDLKIVYKTGSSASVTTKTGSYDSKSLILGGKIYVKGATAFTSYYNSSKGSFYAYTREDKATLYTYKGTSYATIDGELAIGNIVTVSYTDADGKAQSFVAKITSASAYDVAGAERGTFTADGKDSITFDGFGSATIGDKAYTYVVNKNNIVVLKSDSETIGVTLDSEAKTYAAATSDGFVHSYTDANNSKYTVDFDGFGGVTITYKSSYGSPSVYSGTYALGTNTVTIKGATYSYNKEYSVEESGSVLASTDGKVVLAVAGYVVENKIEQFKGYWVKDSDTIEITLDSSNNASVSINGASAIKAKANWNGSVLTFTAKDSDNSNATWAANVETTYTLTIVDGKLVISHFCATGFDDDGAPEFSSTATTATYEVGSKAGDGFEGTYKKGSDVIVLDGKGAGTFTTESQTFDFTYTVSDSTLSLSNFSKYDDDKNTLTITADGLKASFSGDYGNYSYEGNFTKEAETLDAFAGTWSGKIGLQTWTIVIDGKGNFTANGTAYHYTVDSATTASSVEADGSDKYFTFTLKNGSLAVERYDEDMYETYSGTLTKQA